MHNQRMGMLIASGAGALGAFLPWITIPFLGGISGVSGGNSVGWVTFFLYLGAVIFTIVGDKEDVLRDKFLSGAIICNGLGSGFGIWKFIDFKSAMSGLAGPAAGGGNPLGKLAGSMFSVGIGLYIIILAGIAAIILAVALRDK